MSQGYLIVCDNENCDYKIPNETKDANASIKKYTNKPCPECGETLLTEKDYRDSEFLMRYINWINKWFSWVTIFIPKSKQTKITVHVHDGINTETDK